MSFRNPVRTVGVTGAVTTNPVGGGTPAVPPTLRGARSKSNQTNSSGSDSSPETPSATVVGDLLVLAFYGYRSNAVTMPSDWTKVAGDTATDQNGHRAVFTKIATSTDLNGQTYTLGNLGGANTYIASVMLAFKDGTKVTAGNKTPLAAGQALNAQTPSITSGAVVLGLYGGYANSGPSWQWPTPANGGPPTTQPAWSEILRQANPFSSAGGCCFSLVTANWATAAAYTAQVTNPGSPAGLGWLFQIS